MAVRIITDVARIVADSRRQLPSKVNEHIAQETRYYAQYNAKVTFSLSPEVPLGPLGNWCQTLTETIEGDDTDPQFKVFWDRYNKPAEKPTEPTLKESIVYGIILVAVGVVIFLILGF